MSVGIGIVGQYGSPTIGTNAFTLGDAGAGGDGGLWPFPAASGPDGIQAEIVDETDVGRFPGAECDDDYQCRFGTCSDGVCQLPGFGLAPAGTYTMGAPAGGGGSGSDEIPAHSVTLTRSFWVRELEITPTDWEEYLGYDPEGGCSTCPTRDVDEDEAIALVNRMSDAFSLDRCYDESRFCTGVPFRGTFDCSSFLEFDLDCVGFRLPTEAEFEYALRAGTTTEFFCGTSASCMDDYAWHSGNVVWNALQPVGTQDPNPWGFYDIAGNAYEWVWEHSYNYPSSSQVDPVGTRNPTEYELLRGGSVMDTRSALRSSNRFPAVTQPRTVRVVMSSPDGSRAAGEVCGHDLWCASDSCNFDTWPGTCD